MNWLHAYEAKIDCKDLKVTLIYEKGHEICFCGQIEEKPWYIISTLKVSYCIKAIRDIGVM